ncbi:MAG: hypothetical protein WBB69_16420 [Anaerolineales bacterium]|jgi:hypothetical protein
MKYKVHRFDLNMSKDQENLERYLNSLEGEIVSIIPNVTFIPVLLASKVNFLFIVEKLNKEKNLHG